MQTKMMMILKRILHEIVLSKMYVNKIKFHKLLRSIYLLQGNKTIQQQKKT